jgi:hypothetical protein
MNRANGVYAQARLDFDGIVARFPHDLPEPGGVQMIRDAGHALSISREAFTDALIRYSAFVTSGAVPEDLKS